MKKNVRINISISPNVLADAKRIADDRFSGNLSAYLSALIDGDITRRGYSRSNSESISTENILNSGNSVLAGSKSKIKQKIKK